MAYLQMLLAPAFALTGIAFVFSIVVSNYAASRYRELAISAMFGATIVIGMTNPLSLGDGLIFDTRGVLIGAATAFGGPLGGVIAMGLGAIARIFIGGAGLFAGLISLAASYFLALATIRWLKPRITDPILGDAVLGAAITPSCIAIFLLPYSTAINLFERIAPTLLITNVTVMVLLGLVYRHQLKIQQRQSEIAEQATLDPLTKLLNRRGLELEVDRHCFDPEVGQAMLYFDADNFKQINDNHGHDAGDAVLEIIAKRISENLRPGAIFARHGGDEFSIYLTRVSDTEIEGLAERLLTLINEDPLIFNGLRISTSISIGGFWTQQNISLDELITRADAQLLLAKQAGKNRVCLAYDRDSRIGSVA